MSAIHLSHVSFSYSSAVPIVEDATFDLGPGWTGLVGANGAGKSTLLHLIVGSLRPDAGSLAVEPPGLPPVLCEQRVDDLTSDVESFAYKWDRDAVRMRGRLGLDPEDLERWDTLSPGERKRWQIAAALVARPNVLMLDEPTNHLDAEARDLLVSALQDFPGCGIVVSHDRNLLNELTTRTIRLHRGSAELWNGSYDTAHDEWAARAAEQTATYDKMRADQRRLKRRIDDQRRKSAVKDAKRIRERRSAVKRDLDTRGAAATYKHERGQKTGAQTVASMTNSLHRITNKIDATDQEKERGGAISFEFESARMEFLVRYAGPVTAGRHKLFDVDLEVRRLDRIRIAGPNGAGKTSLLATLVDKATIPANKITYLAQETTAQDARRWLAEVRALPPDNRGRVMSLVALLGADPGALLVSDQPSPGEARKVALALGLGTPTWLLVLDEPTNHLDLPSIERLEGALTEYEGALLLITHDDALAEAATETTWNVGGEGLCN